MKTLLTFLFNTIAFVALVGSFTAFWAYAILDDNERLILREKTIGGGELPLNFQHP